MMAIIPKMKRIVSQFSYWRIFSGPSTKANASRAPTIAAIVRLTFSEMMRP
jgi:hypothetical protein